MGRFEQVAEIARARTLVVVRQPEIVFWVFGFPLLLALVLGFAFRSHGPRPSRVAVDATAGGAAAEALAERLRADPDLEVELSTDPAEARRGLRGGALDALVAPGEPPRVDLQTERPEAEVARLRVERALARPPLDGGGGGGGAAAGERLRVVALDERGARYVDFLFPGLLGMNLMSTGLWSIGFSVADLRQRKLLRRLLVTPMRRSSFLGGLLAFRFVFLALELAALVAFGVLALDVPFRTDAASFAALSLLGALAFSGLGMLTASRARTLEAVSGLLNLVMMPMWLGSGVFFSYERFPDALQPFLKALPLTALNDALRDLLLDGRSLATVVPELGILAAWGALGFLIALRIFRWE